MLPNSFKPKKLYNLIRLGSDNDGGYLVEVDSHKKTKTLFSFGLGNDWHFERMFQRLLSYLSGLAVSCCQSL